MDGILQRRIGSGIDIKFWKDRWIGKPLAYRFPRLFQLELDNDCKVADRRCNGG